MEDFARRVRAAANRFAGWVIPHFRQILRFVGLPYCYFYQVDWQVCTASRGRVALDMLYMFFVLRSYPDNYGNCRLYEKPRSEWPRYYGSNYNPYQRGKLFRLVQPAEYQIVFEDKEVCQKLCEGHGFPVPRLVGVVSPHREVTGQVVELLATEGVGRYYVKPATGSAGRGVLVAERKPDGAVEIIGGKGGRETAARYVVQECVDQDERMGVVHPAAVNTVRVLTMLKRSGEAVVVSAFARFGVGASGVDNWSAGGIAIGVDRATGRLFARGFDKKGREYRTHPDSGVEFGEFVLPRWSEVVALSLRVQSRFLFYRILGLDVAVGKEGPVLIEINAFPDFVAQEQCAGPLLQDREVLDAFAEYDLLYNRQQRLLTD